MSKKINHLVVDTTAFIKAANLQDLAENVYTTQEVIDEITNDRQRKRLVVLPYNLKVKNVFTENIVFVTEFAKKTGDYISLSATDIKVMALTYQLEKELVGIEHLKTAPTVQRFVKVTGLRNFQLHPDNIKDGNENTENKLQNNDTENKETNATESEIIVNKEDSYKKLGSADEDKSNSLKDPKDSQEINKVDVVQTKQVELEVENEEEIDEIKVAEDIAKQMESVDLNDDDIDNVMARVSDEEEESDSEESDDEGEWITPSNLATKKKEMEMGEFEDKAVEVACITSDFAMQNVLKQIGLNVTAIDGRVIKQLRTFIFRCTTCFKTTSIMTKLFCPKCGHATLKKVGVSIDDDGNQHIHINGRKPLTARGKRFSLPTPRGGQHFQYPILTEDQHIHKRFATKMARNKTKALDPDYTAGFSPFVMKDVNSKSAVLGIRADKQDVKYWMKNYSKGKKK